MGRGKRSPASRGRGEHPQRKKHCTDFKIHSVRGILLPGEEESTCRLLCDTSTVVTQLVAVTTPATAVAAAPRGPAKAAQRRRAGAAGAARNHAAGAARKSRHCSCTHGRGLKFTKSALDGRARMRQYNGRRASVHVLHTIRAEIIHVAYK